MPCWWTPNPSQQRRTILVRVAKYFNNLDPLVQLNLVIQLCPGRSHDARWICMLILVFLDLISKLISSTFVPFHLSTLTFTKMSYNSCRSKCQLWITIEYQIRAFRSKWSSFYCLKWITTSGSFPYVAHLHGSWWPCNRWGSCSWGQCQKRTHG